MTSAKRIKYYQAITCGGVGSASALVVRPSPPSSTFPSNTDVYTFFRHVSGKIISMIVVHPPSAGADLDPCSCVNVRRLDRFMFLVRSYTPEG